jgi:hypothetical protein
LAYGVEVKNTLAYIDRRDFQTKLLISRHLDIKPVFVVRMMPRHWISELQHDGGFALVMKWQLYPTSHSTLARLVREKLGLPVDAPRAVQEGTMKRFLDWHLKHLGGASV